MASKTDDKLNDILLDAIDNLGTEYYTWLKNYKEENKQLVKDNEEYSKKHNHSSKEYCEYRLMIIDKECELIDKRIELYNEHLKLRIKGSIRFCQSSIKELKEYRQKLRWSSSAWYNGGVL